MAYEEDTGNPVKDRPDDVLNPSRNRGERRQGVPKEKNTPPKPKEEWKLVYEQYQSLQPLGKKQLLTAINNMPGSDSSFPSSTNEGEPSQTFEKTTTNKKRSWTPREKWNDSSKERFSEVNRNDVKLQTRTTQEFAKQYDEYCKNSSMTKRQITEQALAEYMKKNPV